MKYPIWLLFFLNIFIVTKVFSFILISKRIPSPRRASDRTRGRYFFAPLINRVNVGKYLRQKFSVSICPS